VLINLASKIAFLYYQRKQIWFRKVLSIFIINIPIFGNVIKKIYLARFCQAMAFLLNSKVALLKTVELIAQMIQFYPIEHSLNQAEDSILNGNSLNETLEQFKFYPEELIALIKVGEEASQLDTMFSKLAEQYNDEVEQQTKAIGSLLEPILIIGLGVIVGFILIAMYMPLFQLSMGIQ
jgi:type IV pilus assembly protein PilC